MDTIKYLLLLSKSYIYILVVSFFTNTGAFEPILRSCPWLPIVGNHEYYSGEELARYLDSTFETYNDTTETALGGLLAVASFYGPSSAAAAGGSDGGAAGGRGAAPSDSSKVPSGTSRFFSVDYGNVHLIATDMNGYYGLDPCGQSCLVRNFNLLFPNTW